MAHHFDLEEQEQLDQLKHFWKTWGGLITAVLTTVMVVLAGWNVYQFWQARQATQARALLDVVEMAGASKDAQRMEKAFEDIRAHHGGTTQAYQAALQVAKVAEDAGKVDEAKAALVWLATGDAEEGYRALARLRLANLLVGQGGYDEALSQLTPEFPPEFTGVAADRKGDVLTLLGKSDEAAAQYAIAFQAFDPALEYRQLVEVKLNALGVRPDQSPLPVKKDESK